jgi:hypothetical protein
VDLSAPPVGGYACWLDPGDTSKFEFTGGGVRTVYDKSGNGNNAVQSTAIYRGQMCRYPSAFRGRPILSLPDNDTSKGYAVTGISASSRTETGFFVGMWAGSSGGNRGSMVGGNNDGGRQVALESNGELIIIKAGISVILDGSSGQAVTAGVPFVVGWKLTSTTAEIRLNNLTPQPVRDSQTFSGGLTTMIGVKASVSDNQPFMGLMAELVIYSSALSGTDMTTMMSHLLDKHGI